MKYICSKYLWIIYLIIFLTAIYCTIPAFGSAPDSVTVLFKKARSAGMAQKWDEAYQLYDQIINTCPECKHTPASHFWKAWCLSKSKDTKTDAFAQYNVFANKYPGNNYVDDARLQQITLAEGLLKQGHNNYLAFLFQQYHSQNEVLKQHAAFALARLGYKEVLPALRKYATTNGMSLTVQQLIEGLEQDLTSASFQEFGLQVQELYDGHNKFEIQYTIPTSRLDLERNGNLYEISYQEEVVIYDPQMQEVYRYQNLKNLKQNTRYLFDKTIQGSVKTQLNPGEYILVFTIKNLNSESKYICLEQIRILNDKRQ